MLEFLQNLPSRGALSSNAGSIVGRSAVNYICNHDTDPPGDQILHSSEQDVLANCLRKAKQKEIEAKKRQKASERASEQGSKQSNKRKDENMPGSTGPAKRQTTAETKAYTAQQLRSKQNQELADICRALGLPVSGKKDILVQRILKAQEAKGGR